MLDGLVESTREELQIRGFETAVRTGVFVSVPLDGFRQFDEDAPRLVDLVDMDEAYDPDERWALLEAEGSAESTLEFDTAFEQPRRGLQKEGFQQTHTGNGSGEQARVADTLRSLEAGTSVGQARDRLARQPSVDREVAQIRAASPSSSPASSSA